MTIAMRQLALLVQLRLRLLLRWIPAGAGRRSKISRGSRFLIVLLFVALGVPGLSGIATAMFGSTVPGQEGRAYLSSTLPWGLSLMAFFILFYAIVALTATLTYGGDLQLLLLTPVSPRLLLGEKLLSVSFSFAGLMLLTLPGTIGLGHRLHLGSIYDLTALAMVALVPITPAALAMLTVVAALRWLPPARARTLVTVLGFVLGAALVLATQVMLSSSGQKRPDLPAIVPSTWPGRALAAVGLGQTETALGYLLASLLLAGALFVLAIVVSGRFFATGWATYQEVGRRKSGEPSAAGGQRPPIEFRRPAAIGTESDQPAAGRAEVKTMLPAWWPLLHKEWLSLRRDPQRLAMLAYPVVLAAISSYQIFFRASAQGDADTLTALNGTLYGLLAFVAILMLGSITAATVNGEGRSIYLLALAPLEARDVLLAKWAICAAPALAIVEAILALGVVLLRIGPAQALLAALALAALVIALAGLGLLINLLWPRLDPENPRLKASLTATIVSLLSEMIVGVIATILLILTFAWWSRFPSAAAAAACVLLLLTGLICGAALLFGPRLLQRLMTGG